MKELMSAHVLPLLVAAALVGCSSLETQITRPENQGTTMQLTVEVPQSSSSSGSAAPDLSANVIIEDDQGNTLDISAVQMVLDQVEFRRTSGEGCVDSTSRDDGDSCAELAVEPSVLDLPVDSDPITTQPIAVEPGTYEALEFDLHLAAPGDVDNLALLGGSVRIEGNFNGTLLQEALFDPEGEVELVLEDPIELEEGSSSGMTLTVDVASWFRAEDGTVIDPTAAAQDPELSQQVADRIMDSFSIRAGS